MLFVGPLIVLFWASGDVFSGFQRWVEWVALFILGRGICNIHSLRITPGVKPADLLMASMAAGRFLHTCNRLFLKECGLPRTLVPWHAPNTPKKHLYFINCQLSMFAWQANQKSTSNIMHHPKKFCTWVSDVVSGCSESKRTIVKSAKICQDKNAFE